MRATDDPKFKKYLTRKYIIIGLGVLAIIIVILGLAIGLPISKSGANLVKANKLLDENPLVDG